MSKAKTPTPKHHIYHLQVVLEGIEPRIWRGIWVHSDMTLLALHHILQASMGWTGSHLHEFIINNAHYGQPDPEDFRDIPVKDERRQKLGKILQPKLKFRYWYDFGDDWMHQIQVKEVLPVEDTPGSAYVAAGAGACPPEDSGGIPGYQQFLDAYRENPKSKEAREFLRWAGEDFDPNGFDRHAANAALSRLAWNGWI